MSAGIFLLQTGGELVEMSEQPYVTEAVLQELIANYPNLLAGDQMDRDAPRRWLLVSREMGVPSEEDAGDRWAVDHLFLDQDAIPTLVEVKRSSDSRIRREVLGQMLDYAANAVVYWPVDRIKARFENSCSNRGEDPAKVLSDFLGADSNADVFWQSIKTNLQAGRIRMVFVADVIPNELRRIVEFLNGQMDPAEVLAVEIRQFVGQGLKTLVPRVMGQTVEAERKKASSTKDQKQWDEASFFADLQKHRGESEVVVARAILDWNVKNRMRLWWGKGKITGSFFGMFDLNGSTNYVVSVWTYGTIELPFQWMKMKPPFDSETKRMEYLSKLNSIPGVMLPSDGISRRPSIPLSILTDENSLNQLLAIFDWYVAEVKVNTP